MNLGLPDVVVTFLAGLVSGFIVSIPVGPVNLTVINTGLRRGFLAAFLVGLGAVWGEAAYATLALAGHSSLPARAGVAHALQIIAVLVLVGLGIRYLRYQPDKLEANAAVVQRVDERWHHPRSFLLGFALTISNLLLVVVWATLGALLLAHELVGPDWRSRAACLLGVLAGGALWFFLLAFSVSRAHRRVQPQTLARLVRACGVVLLVFAGWMLVRLARHGF